MRVTTATLPFLALLLAASGAAASGQTGSPPPSGDPGPPGPAGQATVVPEAAISITFPAAWAVDIEMRAREDWGLSERYEDAAPLTSWSVLYASDGGRPWCDVTWYPRHPMGLAEHVREYELSMTPSGSSVERSIETEALSLPLGDAYRVVVYNGPTADYTTVYLFGSETSRYLLRCVSDARAPDDWLSLAATVELLDAEAASSPTPEAGSSSG